MKIGIILDEFDYINFSTDTTIEFAKEGLKRNNEIWFFFPSSLIMIDNKVFATAIQYNESINNDNCKTLWLSNKLTLDLLKFDAILIRHDPPYNSRYLTSCYILEKIKDKVLMVNDPTSIRNCPEKLFVTKFLEIHPPTLITMDLEQIIKFRDTHGDIILKPLYQFRGMDIYYLKRDDRNFFSIFESFVRTYQEPIIVQKYLPEVKDGDKRIFLLDGKPIAALNRVPSNNDTRSNMFVGGIPKQTNLSASDERICKLIGPELSKNGLYFAGIDVIGEFVTEINVTSPTGVVQLREVSGINLASEFWNFIDIKIQDFKIKYND